MYTIKAKAGKEGRDNLMRYLNQRGISSKVYFDPVHLTQFCRKKLGYKGEELPVTGGVSQQVLTLPMYPNLGEDEINYVAESIETFLLKKIKN
jgi:perosamine synthetase